MRLNGVGGKGEVEIQRENEMENPFEGSKGAFKKDQISEEDKLRLKEGKWNVPAEEGPIPEAENTTAPATEEPKSPEIGPEAERNRKRGKILAEYEGLESNIPLQNDYWRL